MNTAINFKTTKPEAELIGRIVNRYAMIIKRASGSKIELDALETSMDLTACHLNGCPLDLERLLAADEPSFIHDMVGINAHIDRTTGRLMNKFLPRYTLEECAT